jgi:hypothetical protein
VGPVIASAKCSGPPWTELAGPSRRPPPVLKGPPGSLLLLLRVAANSVHCNAPPGLQPHPARQVLTTARPSCPAQPSLRGARRLVDHHKVQRTRKGVPASKAGEAMGENSTLNRTEPSLGRSG